MGMYAKYTPIRVNFDLAPNMPPSDKKFGRGANQGNLRHMPKTTLWAVLRVLSQSVLFCDAPHLTASDKKLGRGANLCAFYREFNEIREVKEFSAFVSIDSLTSLISLIKSRRLLIFTNY